jgi:tight adherence protein C
MDWITNISHWLSALSTDPEILQLGYSSLLGASVFVLALALYLMISGVWNPLRKRVDLVKGTGEQPARKDRSKGAMAALGSLLMPKVEAKRTRTEDLLRHANFRSEGAVRVFYGIKLVALVLAPLLVLVVLALTHILPMGRAAAYILVAAVLGFLAPDILLARFARRRQQRLQRALPDAMDLLVVCSEAGLGLGAGIQRVAREIALTHPELGDELDLYSMQTRAGMDNRAALKDLEDRTGLDDIQALVATLLQSMRFGTSVADTLRIYSAELRDKRLQRAQEKAARIGTLMIFPLATCIMPSFLLVVLGPAILGAVAALSGSGLGSLSK